MVQVDCFVDHLGNNHHAFDLPCYINDHIAAYLQLGGILLVDYPILSTYCGKCSHNNCKTSNTITVP